MTRGDETVELWKVLVESKPRNFLYVMGRGFDPRMVTGLSALLAVPGRHKVDVVLVSIGDDDSGSAKQNQLAAKNEETVKRIMTGRGSIRHSKVQVWKNRRRIMSREAAKLFSSVDELKDYTDVVIDISAMPRSLYFPLLGKLFFLFESANSQSLPNLHVVVAESVDLDNAIKVSGVDESAQYIHGFVADLEQESSAQIPKLWLPILGESQSAQLERLHLLIDPDEICPILPSPAGDPRRGDSIFTEYQTLLLTDWLVEPRNIIYANERNPFEAYRQIHRTVRYYNESLKPLNGCRTVISALSSKLLSLGALLAACELQKYGLKVALADVPAQGYDLAAGFEKSDKIELYSIWVLGECYAH